MPDKVEKEFSAKIKCGHCGTTAPMLVAQRYSHVKGHETEQGYPYDTGDIYEILLCPACDKVVIREGGYFSETPEDIDWTVVYPVSNTGPHGLPDKIQKAYDAAMKVKNIDGNAFGVLMRRLLELVCDDRNATGPNLASKLSDLAGRGEIPTNLSMMAQQLRQFGNVGAHATIGELTDREIPFLEKLSRAVLEYVYSAPVLVNEAQSRLDTLTKKTAKKSAKALPGRSA